MEIVKTLIWIIKNFGALIVFQILYRFVGFQQALIAGILFAVAEINILKVLRKKISGFLIFSAILIVVFGIINLCLASETFIQYEAIIFNCAFGLYFAVSLFGKKSLIESLAEQQGRIDRQTSADKTYFFNILTSVWASYYFAKAAIFYVLALNFSYADASILRILIGPTSFYLLLAISLGLGPQIWKFLEFLKLMPSSKVPLPSHKI